MGKRFTVRDAAPLRYRQRGVALLVMVTIIALGATWLFVNTISKASSRNALNKQDNARVLAEAKQALVGWVIRQAIEAGEKNPGRLPCPEPPQFVGTKCEGIAAPTVCNEESPAISAPACTAVGRLPWRTLGLPKLLDATGEPLWYVPSPQWHLDNTSTSLNINSDFPGQLTVDGLPQAAVALVVAPGSALDVPACAGNPARKQVHNSLAPDFRDYLECENANYPANATFVMNGPAGSFNDQVLALTTRDVLPGLEAAIMKRIEREIVPQLKTLYAGSEWGTAATLVFPFPAPFDPSASATFQGDPTFDQGLLPVNYYSASCGADPRCSSTFVSWTPPTPTVVQTSGLGTMNPATCGLTGSWYYCTGTYTGSVEIQMTDILANVANTLPPFDASTIPAQNGEIFYYNGAWIPLSAAAITLTRGFSGDASFKYNVKGVVPDIGGLGQYYVRSYRPAFVTHALLDPDDPVTGWFIRNEWYRLAYYAVAPGQTAASSTCSASSTNCLSLTRAGVQEGNKRALLLLAGRSLANQTRPSSALPDYLDTPENNDPTGYPPAPATATPYLFEQPRIDSSANDRVIVVDQN